MGSRFVNQPIFSWNQYCGQSVLLQLVAFYRVSIILSFWVAFLGHLKCCKCNCGMIIALSVVLSVNRIPVKVCSTTTTLLVPTEDMNVDFGVDHGLHC